MENIFGSWLWPWSSNQDNADEEQITTIKPTTTTTTSSSRRFRPKSLTPATSDRVPEVDLKLNISEGEESPISNSNNSHFPWNISGANSENVSSSIRARLKNNCTLLSAGSKCSEDGASSNSSGENNSPDSESGEGVIARLRKFANLSDLTNSFQANLDTFLRNLDLQQPVPLDEYSSSDPTSNPNLYLPLPYHQQTHRQHHHHNHHHSSLNPNSSSGHYHQISFFDNNSSLINNNNNKIEIYNENLFFINNLFNSNNSSSSSAVFTQAAVDGSTVSPGSAGGGGGFPTAAIAFDAETVQMVTMLVTSIVLGVVILATVIGECVCVCVFL